MSNMGDGELGDHRDIGNINLSKGTNERGKTLVEYITFVISRSQSVIDITLATLCI